MAKVKSIQLDGQTYDRDGFRNLLQQRIQEIRSDPKSAYRDSNHPAHAEAVADVNYAYRWLNGEMGETEETGLVKSMYQQELGEKSK